MSSECWGKMVYSFMPGYMISKVWGQNEEISRQARSQKFGYPWDLYEIITEEFLQQKEKE